MNTYSVCKEKNPEKPTAIYSKPEGVKRLCRVMQGVVV